ncbi:hypothetical protein MPDQ_002726 [Monascus purpureus]|uniref:Uncharacterized protein n=1 Tax=Monascus purpureus TaxID=5098 RepID=A0A507QNZ5_MONPU|nr:hypothetical protein MPDQ_002726 [Monascus purpureus]BDD59321.1 hypothetical protein MAP00_004533 [Monascus purpureus]
MPNSKLLDTELGGKSTQYESIRTFTEPPAKQSGQLGAGVQQTVSGESDLFGDSYREPNDNRASEADDKLAREQCFGGMTGNIQGEVDKDLKPGSQKDGATTVKTRRQLGYGPGSGIGA